MYVKDYRIKNKVGLHARPASLFVRKAGAYKSDVRIRVFDQEIDGKSILSVMSLGIGHGTDIQILAQGPDEEAAVEALIETLDSFED